MVIVAPVVLVIAILGSVAATGYGLSKDQKEETEVVCTALECPEQTTKYEYPGQ